MAGYQIWWRGEEDLNSYTAPRPIAYDLKIQSTDGKRVPFGSMILSKGDHITSIVVFICHFFCTYNQYYIRTVSYHLADSILEANPAVYPPCQLIIIGCGEPVLITPYVIQADSTFPIFTASSGQTYERIHVTQAATRIVQPVSYIQVSLFRAIGMAIKHIWMNRTKAWKSGRWDRNSGRWMFQYRKHLYVRRIEHAERLTAENLFGMLDCDVGKKPPL